MNNASTKLMETRLINYELPEGWSTTVLDKVGHWSTGGTPSRKVTKNFGGGIPWVKSGDLNDGRVKITEETLTREGIESSAAKIVPAGAVIIALYGATIGKLGMLEIDAATNQACANCEVIGEIIDRWFLFYYLLYQRRALIETGQGGAQPNLTNRIIRNWPLLLPPLVEQKRIVAKAEELLERVDATEKRVARVSMIVKRFRQAALAAACSGRLTADWRDKELHINSSNQPLDGNKDLPSSWSCKSIRDLASSKKGSIQSGPFGSNLLHSEFQPTGILVIGIDNVLDGKFSFGKQHRISHQKYELLKKYAARPLDVLVTVMATVGRCCVVPSDIETAIITKHVYRITADHAVVNPYYLMQCIRGCPAVLAQVQSEIQGVTRPGINGAILKGINIPLPPITEQHEIVRRVETLFNLADTIEKRVAAASLSTEKLTQAILAKAFRGELVPTEAELARHEGLSYEPASDLLARIKSERDAKHPSQKVPGFETENKHG